MKDSKCRFIEEYANFQIRQYKKDLELYDYDEERNAFWEKAIKNIEKAVVLNGTVSFHFFDGHIESREYKEKKKGYPRKNLVKDVKM